MWRSASIGLSVWTVAVGMLALSRAPDNQVIVLTLQFVFVVVAAATASGRRRAERAIFFWGIATTLTADLFLTSDSLTSIAVCLTFIVVATTYFVLPWGLATLVAGTSLASAAALAVLMGLGGRTALALAFPAACYCLAAWTIMRVLRRFTSSIDSADFAAEEAHVCLLEAQATARAASAYARTLHDTVINTLAAIAAGGAAVSDADKVRSRCAHNLVAIRALVAEERQPADSFESVGAELSLKTSWTGLAGAALSKELDRLSLERREALRGVIKGTLLNVERHARTQEASIHAAAMKDGLSIVVTDTGIGHDPAPVDEKPHVQSIAAQAAENGFMISTTSAHGAGTSIRIEAPYHDLEPEPVEGTNWSRRASELRRTATWWWAALVGAASLAIAAVGSGTPASYASALLVLALSFGVWLRTKDGTEITTTGALVVAIAVPVTYVLGLVGAFFGRGDALFWPAIGLTPLLIMLLNLTPQRWPLAMAAGSLALTAIASALVLCDSRPVAAGAAIMHATIELTQLAIWMLFIDALNVLVVRSTQSSQQMHRDIARRAALGAARQTREHWRDAQLERALSLMNDIVEKRRHPSDPSTAVVASKEEHALRQLLMLNPDLVNLSPVLARSVALCRQLEIQITARIGSEDLESPAIAHSVETALAKIIGNTGTGSAITFAYFGDHPTVVGPSGFCDRAIPLGAHVKHLPGQDLITLRSTLI